MAKDLQRADDVLEKCRMDMQGKVIKHEEKLKAAAEKGEAAPRVYPLNKRDKKRVRKIEENKEMSREEKDAAIEEIKSRVAEPQLKRKNTEEHKESRHYICGDKPIDDT